MSRFHEFFSKRSVPLPPEHPDPAAEYDFSALRDALMTPDEDTPPELVEALFLIDSMSDSEGQIAVVEALRDMGEGVPDDVTASEAAMLLWLTEPEKLADIQLSHGVIRERSFEYFQARQMTPTFAVPGEHARRRMCAQLDRTFEKMGRGTGCQLHFYDHAGTDLVWILSQHGDVCRRDGTYDRGTPSTIFYRPEKFDVITYDKRTGELGICATTKKEKMAYLAVMGWLLFEQEDLFEEAPKYTLRPLWDMGAASLRCDDIPGVEKVVLREVQLLWHPGDKYIETRRCVDLFRSMERRGHTLPRTESGGLPIYLKARFDVTLEGEEKPRRLTIVPTTRAKYERDDDSSVIDTWLRERGFRPTGRNAG